MANGIFGLVFVAFAVSTTGWAAKQLRRRDEPTSKAWRVLLRSGTFWLGVVLLVSVVSWTAAGALLMALSLIVLVFFAVMAARGVRRLPEFWRSLRSISDPAAWRGEPPSAP